jgi:RecB family endonuclease NucS
VRLVVARCSVDYAGRLSAHLPLATRLLVLKNDGSVLVHSDSLSYKPLNWMSPPAVFTLDDVDEERSAAGVTELWRVTHAKTADMLVISIHEILHDSQHDLGIDPGLQKDGVEADLQRLLAEQIELLGEGHTLVRREFMTAIGPVDILARDAAGAAVAVEIKRRGDIDGVEQLTRYLELMNRDPALTPVTGVFAAQEIKPQARTLATDRGIRCLLLDYDAMRGLDNAENRLF